GRPNWSRSHPRDGSANHTASGPRRAIRTAKLAVMKPSQRLALGAVALLVVVVGAWLSTGTPNLTVVNDGIGVTYPWRRGLGAWLAGAGCVLLGYAVRRTWVR